MNSEGQTQTIDQNNVLTNRERHVEDIFRNLFELAIQNRFSVAIWRLPDQDTIHLIIDSEGFDALQEIDLEELDQGFLFCPYDKGQKVFIRKHISFDSENNVPELSTEVESEIREKVEIIFEDRTNQTSENIISNYYQGVKGEQSESSKEEYCQIVEQSIHAIQSGDFEKVVPSRTKSIRFNQHFDIIDNFFNLSRTYPRSFVYMVSVADIGSWMGASPETLIEIEGGKKFRTISLAGTQKYDPEVTAGSVAWTQKEIEEQALVSRFIINCFKKIRLREFVEKGPKTITAGKLLHLKTVFEVDIVETGFHNLGTVMLKLLHPTAAVCGMPMEAAHKFLQSVEKHVRKYFCGFLGPVDNSENTHLFVNLRCMELFKDEAVLYAGAGVTEDSIPEKEWAETEIKCSTLLDIMAGE